MYIASKTPSPSTTRKIPARSIRVYHGYIEPMSNDIQTAEEWADFTSFEPAEIFMQIGA